MTERERYRYEYRQWLKATFGVPVSRCAPAQKLQAINEILRNSTLQDPETVFLEELREIAKHYDITKTDLLRIAGDPDIFNLLQKRTNV